MLHLYFIIIFKYETLINNYYVSRYLFVFDLMLKIFFIISVSNYIIDLDLNLNF